MAERLIECVPNFSEGRNQAVICEITGAIQSVEGCILLNVDVGVEMNRTVVTFIGSPECVVEAAFRAIKKASELIDMRAHKGSHPRLGATDVCPLVPVRGVSLAECVEYSRHLAHRIGEELKIPVYLYEHSAQTPVRKNLANIRAGEYEGLERKLKNPAWLPDSGPAEFNAKAGATVVGAREFLIAYNINLNTREPKLATDIAFELRTKGRSARRGNTNPVYLWGTEILKYRKGEYPCGLDEFVGTTFQETINHCRDQHGYNLPELLELHGIDPEKPEGESVKIPGKFPFCKAIGWYVPEYDRAQISINLTNYRVTSMHHVLEKARNLAAERGLVVTGSEIVGLVPYEALLETGIFYLKRQRRSTGIPIRDILNTAVQSLGLGDVSDFNVEERVLGLPKFPEDAFVEMKLSDFVDEVSRESPAPGGGSVAALSGALGASLGAMVANLTANRRGSEKIDAVLNEAAVKFQRLKSSLLAAVDEDATAFRSVLDANRMPAGSEAERSAREEALQEALRRAIQVPLRAAEMGVEILEVIEIVGRHSSASCISDIGVGAHMAYAAVKGGTYNVMINLKGISDMSFISTMRGRCIELETLAQAKRESMEKMVRDALGWAAER